MGPDALAPWIVRLLTVPAFYPGSRVVPLLAFGATAFIAFNVMSIGIGRAKQTQMNWVVTGAAAALNIGLNFVLIPPYGMMGAAAATLVAYAVIYTALSRYLLGRVERFAKQRGLHLI